jgi:hypothetical protein
MSMSRRFLGNTAILVTAGFFAACSGNSGSGGNDQDASSDATGPEAGMDATGPDAEPEGGSDGAADGNDHDATPEGGPEMDSGHDSGTEHEGETDAKADAPGDASEDGHLSDAAADAADAGPSCPGCVVLATANNPVGLTADANNVYWLDSVGDKGTVVKVPIAGLDDGGTPATLASNQALGGAYSVSSYSGITVDATSVYWTTADLVMKAPIDGSAAPKILSGSTQPNAIVVDATNVYWTDSATGDPPYGGVLTIPKDGTSTGNATTLVANAGNVGGLAVVGGTLYYAVWPKGIFSAPIADGGAPTTIESGFGAPAGIAVSSTQIFWTGFSISNAGLFAAPLGGLPDGGAPAVISPTSAQPQVVTDASNVYWIAGDQVLEAPLAGFPDGGAPKVLAANQNEALLIAVDPLAHGNVYWASGTAGNYVIAKIPK